MGDFAKSVHAPLGKDKAKGCESCHGPAGNHVKSGGRARFVVNPVRLSPEKASASKTYSQGAAIQTIHSREVLTEVRPGKNMG